MVETAGDRQHQRHAVLGDGNRVGAGSVGDDDVVGEAGLDGDVDPRCGELHPFKFAAAFLERPGDLRRVLAVGNDQRLYFADARDQLGRRLDHGEGNLRESGLKAWDDVAVRRQENENSHNDGCFFYFASGGAPGRISTADFDVLTSERRATKVFGVA